MSKRHIKKTNKIIRQAMEYLKKIILLLPACMMCLVLSGCALDVVDTNSDIYHNIQQQTQQFTNNSQKAGTDSVEYFTEEAYAFCNKMKMVAPFIMIGSILVGVLLLHMVTEDQAVRRRAWMVFIIGIPVLAGVVTYGLSWLVGTFL